jgi:hypothetical protein
MWRDKDKERGTGAFVANVGDSVVVTVIREKKKKKKEKSEDEE